MRRPLLHAHERPGGIGIGQMAAVRQNAPLECPRVVAVLEHLRVVIGLEDEHVSSVDGLLDARRHEAEIGRERAARGARDAVAHGVRRIVRDVERVNRQVPDAERPLDGVEALRGDGRAAAHVLDRRAPREDWQLIPLRERHEARDVVAVLVRDEHAVERSCVDALGCEPLLDARRADARVEQEPHAVHLYIDRIALAAAGEYRYLHVSSPILTPKTVNGLQSPADHSIIHYLRPRCRKGDSSERLSSAQDIVISIMKFHMRSKYLAPVIAIHRLLPFYYRIGDMHGGEQ